MLVSLVILVVSWGIRGVKEVILNVFVLVEFLVEWNYMSDYS